MKIIIIPAYEPDESLLKLTEDFSKIESCTLVIVDDGSGEKFSGIFDTLKERRLTVLTHEQNRGKGAAIKTALEYIGGHFSGDFLVATVDCDGQHSPEDTMRLFETARSNPEALSIGVRKFSGKIPLRSKLGNNATKLVFRICSGIWISDTQTGLRAFSSSLLPVMQKISGDRYEYEMNMLLYCAHEHIPVVEIPIETIYHDMKNSCSHFNTFRDASRICKVLFTSENSVFLFAGASIISFIADYVLFFPLTALCGLAFGEAAGIATGNVAARLLSASLNYFLNSTFVFRKTGHRAKSIVQYAVLAAGILLLNTLILYALAECLLLPKAIAKIVTELILFVISYTVQRTVIFNHKKH